VILEVPLAGESASSVGALATFIGAEVGLIPMAVHGVGLTLMAEEACGRRKPGIFTRLNLAAVWLEMGIHEFAAGGGVRLAGSTEGRD
jgi:hypothetical protein